MAEMVQAVATEAVVKVSAMVGGKEGGMAVGLASEKEVVPDADKVVGVVTAEEVKVAVVAAVADQRERYARARLRRC